MKNRLLPFLLTLLPLAAPLSAFAGPAAVTVADASTTIVEADQKREWLFISVPPDAAQSVFIALEGVAATTTGIELQPGDLISLSGPAAKTKITGIVASGTEEVRTATP